ncbi:MAG: DUF5678 domain-containing protein [bacterium]
MTKIISDYLLPYENKWVAVVNGKKVVASAVSMQELSKRIAKMNLAKEVVMTKVFPFSGSYSPLVS